MILLPPEIIKTDFKNIDLNDQLIKKIYRLITFSRHHTDDNLLDYYLNSIHTLQELLVN